MRPIKFEPYTKVEVHWDDIIADASWLSQEDVDKAEAAKIVTIGFFLKNSKKCIKLASDICNGKDSDVKVIPWGTVTNVFTLRRGLEEVTRCPVKKEQ